MRILLSTTLAILWALSATAALAQDQGPARKARGERGPGEQRRGPGESRFQMPPIPLIRALDADGDGKLSKQEIENAATALKKLDKDGDGKLSQDEIGWPPMGRGRGGFGGPGGRRPGAPGGFGGPGGGRGGFGGGPGAPGGPGGPGGMDIAARIMSNDKNKDGKVTKDELPEFMQRMMKRADTNKDGAIDKDEAKKMSEAFGRGGFGRGGPGGRGGERPKRPRRPNRDKG